MSSPTAPTIDATGISAPTFAQILTYLQAQYLALFGPDAYLGNDSQDGQLLGIFARALADENAAIIAAYNARSPATAQGVGLSSAIKINGLTRLGGSSSTATFTVTGTANTSINNGQVNDSHGPTWNLPSSVTIPNSGTINVTATCATAGPVGAPGTLSIATPVFGWQSVSYVSSSVVVGANIEDDAQARVRQSVSTSLPSETIFDGIVASVAAVPGVTRVGGDENATNSTDANGVPARNMAFVIEGGSALAIATAINLKKPPGIPTYGTTAQNVTSAAGTTRTINFSYVTEATVTINLTLKRAAAWSDSNEAGITASIATYLASLSIGQNVSYFGLLPAAINVGTAGGQGTYEVTAMTIAKNGGGAGTSDLTINWNEVASGSPVVNYTLT